VDFAPSSEGWVGIPRLTSRPGNNWKEVVVIELLKSKAMDIEVIRKKKLIQL